MLHSWTMQCDSNVRSNPEKHLLHSFVFWDSSATPGITFRPVSFYLTHSLNVLLMKRKLSAASALPDLGIQIRTVTPAYSPESMASTYPANTVQFLYPKIRDDLINKWISPYQEDRVMLRLSKFQASRCPHLFLSLQKERHSFFPSLTNTWCFPCIR